MSAQALLEFLYEVFRKNKNEEAVIWNDRPYSYGWLLGRVAYWAGWIHSSGIRPGAAVFLEADFSPNAIALFLALADARCILIPFTEAPEERRSECLSVSVPDFLIRVGPDDSAECRASQVSANPSHYETLRKASRPGLVLFSSGSTGRMKAAVHDLSRILEKFKIARHRLRTITFLLYDHIGGVNTLLYTLSNAGCVITLSERTPAAVLGAVEKHRAELLPTSPTFLRLLLLSEDYKRFRLDSLKTVTYGTEPMPESTLERFHKLFPAIQLLQTYGLSELGILRSKSKSSDSLWMKIGGEGFQTRIVEGKLQIKADSAMLGYLNAPSPFTPDGWFETGDTVITDGEYIRILGRETEIINVGGQKVYPAEVESVIGEMPEVAEATVYGEKNAIMGRIVCARIRLLQDQDPEAFCARLKKYCLERLERYKVPVRVEVVQKNLHSDRMKKIRS